MRIRAFWGAILVCGVAGHTRAANAPVDRQRAQAWFREAQAPCERDGGRPWAVSVCGPMVIREVPAAAARVTRCSAASTPGRLRSRKTAAA